MKYAKQKKIAMLLIAFMFFAHAQSNTCLPEGIIFETQAQIDAFPSDFPGCTVIEGSVTIAGDNITNLDSLISIFAIAKDLNILSSTSLSSLNGLNNLVLIGRNVLIEYNPSLASLSGFSNLVTIGGYLWLYENNALTDLSGLEKLSSLGELRLWWNSSLTRLNGLESIYALDVGLDIMSNNALYDLSGLNNLTFIGEYCLIDQNYGLVSLAGLENLNHIGESLTLVGNPVLSSLSALSNLYSLEGMLDIQRNKSLESLIGLDNIAAAGLSSIRISNNDSLSTCEVKSICEYLASPSATVTISNNAPGCNNPQGVLEACESSNVEEADNHFTRKLKYNIYPNPTSGIFTIEGSPIHSIISIFNAQGMEVYRSEQALPAVIDLRKQPRGVYLIRVEDDGETLFRKVVIN